MPESSANAGNPVWRLARRALASAFSTKVPCGSSASGTPSSVWGTTSMPSGASIWRNSRSFPGLPLARTSRLIELELEGGALRGDELLDPALGEIEHHAHMRARERTPFRGPLQ